MPDSRIMLPRCGPSWLALAMKNLHDLNGSKVHRLANVMTLVHEFHVDFHQLKVWFVATQKENKYKLKAAEDFILCDPDKLPVPSPTFLAIHAKCAEVAHLLGAAECIDKFYHDIEDGKTLDPHGASADILEHAIFKLQAVGYEIIA